MKKYDFVGVNEAKAIEMKRCLRANLDKILINPSYSSTFSSNENLSSIQIVSKHEIDNYMLNTLLRDNDVLSMAHSLEVRPILLDHKLVELAFSLNDNFKVRNDTLKSVLIDSVKDIIPSEVYNKRKQGFAMPFINWMNKPLNKKFNQIIFNPKLNLVFNEIYLKQLQYRVKSRELESIDWLSFIFASWLVKYSIHTD
jgi:asparagine synthase (glutamine-hydrolysing)